MVHTGDPEVVPEYRAFREFIFVRYIVLFTILFYDFYKSRINKSDILEQQESLGKIRQFSP